MIVRDQPSIFKVLFSWRGTILPKILPSLGFVMLISAIIGGVEYVDLYRFPEIPLVGFTLIGVVLSIFWVLRIQLVMIAGGKHVSFGVF
jgi:putative membrane protein